MREIILTMNQVAVVDDQDYEWLSKFLWFAAWRKETKSYYAMSRDNAGRVLLMHRLILGLDRDDPRQGDHIKSGQTLLNTRGNLRIATSQQNQWNARIRSDNTTGFKGVSFEKRRRNWRAVLQVEGKQRYIGSFKTPEAAYAAWTEAARKYHGEFFNSGQR